MVKRSENRRSFTIVRRRYSPVILFAGLISDGYGWETISFLYILVSKITLPFSGLISISKDFVFGGQKLVSSFPIGNLLTKSVYAHEDNVYSFSGR